MFVNVFQNIFFFGDVFGLLKRVLSNLNIYIGDVFGSKFHISDIIGIAFIFVMCVVYLKKRVKYLKH